MKILLNSTELEKELSKNLDLGFVPTMGSIHKGHEHLIKNAKKKSKKILVSIFVNPTQFNNLIDYKKYPKNIKQDLDILKKLKVNYVFLPKVSDIYKNKRKKKIKLKKKDLILCAKYRKGHFEGVLDVMDRLTKLINPKRIFMGEKDYQQYLLIKKYLEIRYNTQIIKCKTIRDNSNIALSSRNLLLSKNHLKVASKVYNELFFLKQKMIKQKNINSILKNKIKELMRKYKITIEYLELRKLSNLKKSVTTKSSNLFIAYYINKIRLIDNL